MKSVSGRKIFSLVFMSEQLLEITPAEELRGKSMLVSVTYSLSVPLDIFHLLAACLLKIFSILSRDWNSVTVPANVIVRRNFISVLLPDSDGNLCAGDGYQTWNEPGV